MNNNKEIYHIDKHIKYNSGHEVILNTPWILWKQNSYSRTKQEIIPLCKFHTIAGFWTLINNLKKPRNVRIIYMREHIIPQWEDPNHINGGYFIIDFTKLCNLIEPGQSCDDVYQIFINFLVATIGESFTKNFYNSDNITGIMYINEPIIKQIRFWLSDYNIPLDKRNISTEYVMMLSSFSPLINNHIWLKPFNKSKNKVTDYKQFNVIKKNNLQ